MREAARNPASFAIHLRQGYGEREATAAKSGFAPYNSEEWHAVGPGGYQGIAFRFDTAIGVRYDRNDG